MRNLLGRRRAGDRSGRSDRPGPVVEYARILDGESLWVSVLGAGPDAGLGLEPDDGPAVRLVDDAGHEPGDGRLAVRCRLDDVLPGSEGTSTLVLLDGRDRVSRLDAAAGAVGGSPVMRIPVTADGRWQHDLTVRRGRVTVHRRPADPAIDLVSAVELPDAIGIDVRLPPDRTRPQLVLVRGGDQSVEYGTVTGTPMPDPEDALAPAGAAEHVVRFRVTDLDLPLEPGLAVRTLYESPTGRLPVRRRRNDLRDASAAVNEPTVFADAGQQVPRLRLRFDDDGLVLLRRAEEGEEP